MARWLRGRHERIRQVKVLIEIHIISIGNADYINDHRTQLLTARTANQHAASHITNTKSTL